MPLPQPAGGPTRSSRRAQARARRLCELGLVAPAAVAAVVTAAAIVAVAAAMVAAAAAVIAAAAAVIAAATMFALVAVTLVVITAAFAVFTRRAVLVEAGAASGAPTVVAAGKRQGASGAQREKPNRNQCCDP
jgi:hypothetical protein